MASLAVHRTPSAGSLIKKIIEINSELGIREISSIIRQSTHRQGSETHEYADVEVIDEEKALRLARATCDSSN